MPKIEPKEKTLVAIVSAALGVIMGIATIIAVFVLHFQNMPFTWDQMLILAMMIAIFPPAVVEWLDLRWERGIDKNIPRLLREIAESGKTGLTLIRAIEVSADTRLRAPHLRAEAVGCTIILGQQPRGCVEKFRETGSN